jgi:hypothetical protein
MASWTHLIRFEATDGKSYFARGSDIHISQDQITGYSSYQAANESRDGQMVQFAKL